MPAQWAHLTIQRRYAMLKKILCAAGVVLLMAFSNAQAAKCDAACVARIKADAERGNAMAQGALAECYDRGICEGIPHDYTKARIWYEKAAGQGVAEAQYNLGLMYHEGQGVRQDYVKARQWFEKAAAQGDADAQSSLGVMYDEGKGVPQDYAKARKWYEKAAAQGDAQAQNNLGFMYAHGHGVRQNVQTAKEWFSKSCDNGDQKGCDNYRILNEAGL